MDLLHTRCAGLDVHKDTVVACARVVGDGGVQQHVKTFGTTTKELLALSEWLTGHGCTHVAMEATGVYWKPVWHVLEGSFELVLANAMHVKNLPGRKTDVNDAMWISDLLAHGLIRGSFVPEQAVQEMRALTRTRKQFVREKASHVQRIHKTLEDANVKFGSIVADIMGVGGRAILEALIAGETDPEKLVGVIHTKFKATRSEFVEALRGRVTRSHRFLLKLHLDHIRSLEATLASLDAEIGDILDPFRALVALLITIPGVSDTVAHVILSEIGQDMSRFPTVGHLISWAGLCPRSDESAGKRRSTRLRKGAPWLKTALVQSAWAASRAKRSYLRAQFLRLKSRRGPRKAIMAVAASILTAVYFMVRDRVEYRDLGPDHFDRLDGGKLLRRMVRKLEDLGYEVQLNKAA